MSSQVPPGTREPASPPFVPARSADSAGVPWAGRTFAPTGFEGDDGAADPALGDALRRLDAGQGDLADVVRALGDVRVLVPVVAVLGEADEPGTPGADATLRARGSAHGDKSADMALVTLRSPDGRKALPVFTGVGALAAWDAGARPVPVGVRRAALSAVDEGCSLLVLDPAGPVSAVLPRPALWAVAQGQAWTPSPRDPEVAAAVTAAATPVADVRTAHCEPGRRAELAVVLRIVAGLDRERLDAVLQEVTRRLGESSVVAERVDSLELRVLPA